MMQGAKKAILFIIVAAFWLAVWQGAAALVGSELLLPTPFSVLKTLFGLVKTAKFWQSLLHTLLRVLAGFSLGIIAGTLLGTLTAASKLLNSVRSAMPGRLAMTVCTAGA